jgi:hypothetical protein
MAADFDATVRPHLDALLEPGEVLAGVAAASHQKTFSGGLYAVGVSDRRLILQPLGRRIEPKGGPVSVTPEAIESADLDGAGGGWWTAPSAVLDAAAVTLKLKLRDGSKFKLSMMRGGSGALSGLGGGEAQRDGLMAITEWLARQRKAG